MVPFIVKIILQETTHGVNKLGLNNTK